jgi:hypothetical protein
MISSIRSRLPTIIVYLAALTLAALLLRSVIMFLNYNWTLIHFPFNVDYGEGPILDQVMRLAHFQNIYQRNLQSLPFTISNYPPLYHLIQVPFAWIFGPAFWYGRVINLVALLATSLIIGMTLYTLTRDMLASIIGGVFLLAIPYILHWSGFVRVDSLALFLSWAGIFSAVRWPDRRVGIITAAAFLTAAIFTKQSYGLAAPLAAFIFLLSRKPRWRALELAAWTAGFSLFLFLLINLITQGGFYFNIITSNVNPFKWKTVQENAQKLYWNMNFLVIISLVYLVAGYWLWRKTWFLAAPYLVAATISGATIGKSGSNVNYLLELGAALSLVTGAFLVLPAQRWYWKVVVLILLAAQMTDIYTWAREDYYNWPMGRAAHEGEMIDQMVQFTRQADGPVLADEFMGVIPLAGKNLVYQPFEYKQLILGGIWDGRQLIQDISDKKFALILLYDPTSWDSPHERWTDDQLIAIERYYQPSGRTAQTIVYTPKP